VGANRVGLVSEYTVFPSPSSQYGAYGGLGFGSWFGDFDGVRTMCVHLGLASRFGETWQVGAGLEYNHADALLHWTNGSNAASDHFVSAHAWIEAGSRVFGVRLQIRFRSPSTSRTSAAKTTGRSPLSSGLASVSSACAPRSSTS
jgi:hypothetical protein